MTGGLLTKRALLLAKLEATPGVDANPTPTADAVLVSDPSFTTDLQVIERDYVSQTLSKYEHQIGRVMAGFEFTVDFRSNGKANSGSLADAPILATLMAACGYDLVGGDNMPAGVIPANKNSAGGSVAWATGGAVTATEPKLYTLEVSTAGGSGVAAVTITCPNDATTGASVTLTNATAVTLGDSGATITPTITGTLALGDKFHVMVFPTGVVAKPKTDAAGRLTLYLYMDGNLHKGLNATGNFTVEANGGETGRVTFNFTAVYVPTTATPVPTNAVYDRTLPPQVELALLSWGGNADMKAAGWTIDQGNEINARLDVNKENAYLGSKITDRAPSGGFTPEAQIESDHPFWQEFVSAASKSFTARVGSTVGQQVVTYAPVAQTSEQTYSDRDGILTFDKTVLFKSGPKGDDDLFFCFC